MSFLNHALVSQHLGFPPSRAKSGNVADRTRVWQLIGPKLKEVCKILFVLAVCLATMTALMTLDYWMWISH
jgi:hypothetical protein